MSTQSTAAPVRTSIVVEVPVQRAFEAFTQEMQSWWPADHHVLQGELAEMRFEPREGGRIYDVATDGGECTWARVLAYEPPDRLVFSWDLNLQWGIEENPDHTSEVEVRFIPESDSRTRVELEHRHIERHGDGWEAMHGSVGSAEGWPKGLEAFAAYLAA
ncbi:MAG TPA: SRPBCC family protein [Solirubrobacteraceae bacterium]|nr:SRPBCC family protein [Solirubrobacteraceae bacterium]